MVESGIEKKQQNYSVCSGKFRGSGGGGTKITLYYTLTFGNSLLKKFISALNLLFFTQ